ncbi:MAG: hypothetical protein K1X28_02925 [Parachlamydiales bacterium]|nr:hypothetical protein [Parachlamydiales bacterium]
MILVGDLIYNDNLAGNFSQKEAAFTCSFLSQIPQSASPNKIENRQWVLVEVLDGRSNKIETIYLAIHDYERLIQKDVEGLKNLQESFKRLSCRSCFLSDSFKGKIEQFEEKLKHAQPQDITKLKREFVDLLKESVKENPFFIEVPFPSFLSASEQIEVLSLIASRPKCWLRHLKELSSIWGQQTICDAIRQAISQNRHLLNDVPECLELIQDGSIRDELREFAKETVFKFNVRRFLDYLPDEHPVRYIPDFWPFLEQMLELQNLQGEELLNAHPQMMRPLLAKLIERGLSQNQINDFIQRESRFAMIAAASDLTQAEIDTVVKLMDQIYDPNSNLPHDLLSPLLYGGNALQRFVSWIRSVPNLDSNALINSAKKTWFEYTVRDTLRLGAEQPVIHSEEAVATLAILHSFDWESASFEKAKAFIEASPLLSKGRLFKRLLDPNSRMPTLDRSSRLAMLAKLEKLRIAYSSGMTLNDKEVQVFENLMDSLIDPRPERQLKACFTCIEYFAKQPKLFAEWLKEHTDAPLHSLLPSVLYAAICPDAQKRKEWDARLVPKKIREIFKDGKKAKVMIDLLSDPYSGNGDTDEALKLEEYLQIFEGLFKADESPYERCIALGDLQLLDPKKALDSCHLPLKELQALRKSIFQEFLGNKVTPEQADAEIARWRDRNAIFTYLGKLKQLPDDERVPMIASYQQWFVDLVQGRYPLCRYENSPHLQTIRYLGDYDDLLKNWAAKRELEQITVRNPILTQTFGERFIHALKRSIIQFHHLDSAKVPSLYSFLNDEKTVEAALEDSHVEVETLILQALQNKAMTESDISELRSKIAALASPDHALLLTDLREFLQQKSILRHQPDQRELSILVTDDPQDLLLLAAESGGCQSIYGQPHLNKSALSYVMDGKNRAIVLKDPKTQRIVARAVVRLLWDGESPALFVEPHYLTFPNPEIDRILDENAIQLGESLGVPVYTKEKKVENEGRTLYSLSGLAVPFEYSDAAGGMQSGPYAITSALPLKRLSSKAIAG